MEIVRKKISIDKLKKMSEEMFEGLVKEMVDVENRKSANTTKNNNYC